MAKKFIDCKKGDALYGISNSSENTNIFKYYIENITPGTEFDGGDLYELCSYDYNFNKSTYKFRHFSSRHDSLIVDLDYARDDDKNWLYFTTYQGAVDHIIHELQYSIIHKLNILNRVEEKLGVADYNLFIKKTSEAGEVKRFEIYDLPYNQKDTKKAEELLEGKKYNVYKHHVSTDMQGNSTLTFKTKEFFVRSFDFKEDALAWMYKNDKSYRNGKSEYCYDGDRYFIKYEEEDE